MLLNLIALFQYYSFNNSQPSNSHKLSEIEYVFVAKLNRIMKRAHRVWSYDPDVWKTHIELLEKWNKESGAHIKHKIV